MLWSRLHLIFQWLLVWYLVRAKRKVINKSYISNLETFQVASKFLGANRVNLVVKLVFISYFNHFQVHIKKKIKFSIILSKQKDGGHCAWKQTHSKF